MGLKFHDGTHKLYKGYTGSKGWADSSLLMTPPAWMMSWNTEAHIGGILKNSKSKLSFKESKRVMSSVTMESEMRVVEQNLLDLVTSTHPDVNLWVLKGLHQASNPHISVGYDGFLWHLDVQTNRLTSGGAEAYVVGMSKGDFGTAEDADGFSKKLSRKHR